MNNTHAYWEQRSVHNDTILDTLWVVQHHHGMFLLNHLPENVSQEIGKGLVTHTIRPGKAAYDWKCCFIHSVMRGVASLRKNGLLSFLKHHFARWKLDLGCKSTHFRVQLHLWAQGFPRRGIMLSIIRYSKNNSNNKWRGACSNMNSWLFDMVPARLIMVSCAQKSHWQTLWQIPQQLIIAEFLCKSILTTSGAAKNCFSNTRIVLLVIIYPEYILRWIRWEWLMFLLHFFFNKEKLVHFWLMQFFGWCRSKCNISSLDLL